MTEPRNAFLQLAAGVHVDDPQSEASAQVSSDVWCWHCCHPFNTPKVVLPVSYDERQDLWKSVGAFCSWGCAKAYNTDSKANYNNARGQLLALLKKKMTGTFQGIVPAPPRSCLQVFGGTMTIEEFRQKSPDRIVVNTLPQRVVPYETIVHERKVEAKRVAMAPGPDLQQNVDFATTAAVPVKNETLRLKRPRPMPSSSDVLARTMGLEISALNIP